VRKGATPPCGDTGTRVWTIRKIQKKKREKVSGVGRGEITGGN